MRKRKSITLDHPWVAAAIKDRAPPGVIADWLEDQEVTLSERCLLYAGKYPQWFGGIGLAAFAAGLPNRDEALLIGKAEDPELPDSGPDEMGRMRPIDKSLWKYVGMDVPIVLVCPHCGSKNDENRYFPGIATFLSGVKARCGLAICAGACAACLKISWTVSSRPVLLAEKKRVLSLFGGVRVALILRNTTEYVTKRRVVRASYLMDLKFFKQYDLVKFLPTR